MVKQIILHNPLKDKVFKRLSKATVVSNRLGRVYANGDLRCAGCNRPWGVGHTGLACSRGGRVVPTDENEIIFCRGCNHAIHTHSGPDGNVHNAGRPIDNMGCGLGGCDCEGMS